MARSVECYAKVAEPAEMCRCFIVDQFAEEWVFAIVLLTHTLDKVSDKLSLDVECRVVNVGDSRIEVVAFAEILMKLIGVVVEKIFLLEGDFAHYLIIIRVDGCDIDAGFGRTHDFDHHIGVDVIVFEVF